MCRNDLALYLVAVAMSGSAEPPNMDRRGGVSSHSLRNLGGYCNLAWTIISIKLETYTLSGIDQGGLYKDLVIKDSVNTIGILEVVKPVVEEIPQDLLDLGSGPDHIGLGR
jgi:hypothetical protein